MDSWYEKPEFEKWNKIVQQLANRIEKKLGGEYKVEWRPLQGTRRKWGLYAPKNFAFPRSRKKANALRVSTKEKLAINGGVNRSRYCVALKGWWGKPPKPAAYMDINQDDTERLEEVASILAEVCRARHR